MMKCLKKFLALGMCVGVMSTFSCSAVLQDEVKKFYLSTGIDEVILEAPEGLRTICYFLNGGYGSSLTGQTALEYYLSQVYNREKTSNNLCSLSTYLATHLEGVREMASDLFIISADKELLLNSGRYEAERRLVGIANFILTKLAKESKLMSNLLNTEIDVLFKQNTQHFLSSYMCGIFGTDLRQVRRLKYSFNMFV